jgi:ribosomal protein S24E
MLKDGGGRNTRLPAELSEKIRVLRKSSFVFENEYDYGGIFELYQRIYQDDEEVMEISPPVILDRRSNGGFGYVSSVKIDLNTVV